MNSSAKRFDYSDNSFFNLNASSDKYIYVVGKSQVKCLNCTEDENEYDDVYRREK